MLREYGLHKAYSFPLSNPDQFKAKALQWIRQFETCCYFDNNDHQSHSYNTFECLIAAGQMNEIKVSAGNCFEKLKAFRKDYPAWIFGYFGYDLKNEIEKLHSSNIDNILMYDLHFFIPKYLIEVTTDQVKITAPGNEAYQIREEIQKIKPAFNFNAINATIRNRITKSEYIKSVEAIKNEIMQGVVYELNYCQEFYIEDINIDPINTFYQLNSMSEHPFSCYYRTSDHFLLSSSPERFLKKMDNTLISQPVKGTLHRSNDPKKDAILKDQLRNDPKERAENVMIVDLVRNDLTKSSYPASVKVEELFGIYSFNHVHQMISTVTGKILPDVHFIDAIKNAFPMGSMTGAPKIMAMELIEHYEKTKRGLFSGAVGYISPAGDFDFNVVIRSILYNQSNRYLSFQAGSAITFDSNAENEYDECLLKAKPMFSLLKS